MLPVSLPSFKLTPHRDLFTAFPTGLDLGPCACSVAGRHLACSVSWVGGTSLELLGGAQKGCEGRGQWQSEEAHAAQQYFRALQPPSSSLPFIPTRGAPGACPPRCRGFFCFVLFLYRGSNS